VSLSTLQDNQNPMKKKLILLAALGLMAIKGWSQPVSEEAAVKELVYRLFSGMEKGDSAMVHSAFAPNVTMATVYRDKANTPQIKFENSLVEFLKAVGTPHADTWYEEIWNLSVKIDGDLAQAWCEYAFYIGNKFSHCGVDSFEFHKGKDGWKIFHLADTRRRTGCTIPAEIENKHK